MLTVMLHIGTQLNRNASLPNNRCAVEATFLRKERQLNKESDWKMAYTAQVHAEQLERTSVAPYVSHLVAPDPPLCDHCCASCVEQ